MASASTERFRVPTVGVGDDRDDLLTSDELAELDELVAPVDLPSEVPIAPTVRPWGYGDFSFDPDPASESEADPEK